MRSLLTFLATSLCILFCGSVAAQADLSLAIAQGVGSPRQYSLYSVTVTLTNDGPDAATGVRVDAPLPTGVVYEGGRESSASQGAIVTYGPGAGRWSVGTVAAGATATLTINYFLNAAAAPASYAQVTASGQLDPDSTPGNGTPPTVREDADRPGLPEEKKR